MATSYTAQIQSEYQRLFDTCTIREDTYPEANAIIDKIVSAKERYESVGDQLHIPWYFIGIVHCMEGKLSFKAHLHNGDPLTHRTVHDPKGRPKDGQPPFTWEASAADALKYDKVDQWTDWSVPGMLYKFESYNGFGYRSLSVPIYSPYLWSGSNHYMKGKFIGDHQYSPAAVSKQIGAAVLLRRMVEKQIVSVHVTDRLELVNLLGTSVSFAPDQKMDKVLELQKLLNLAGAHVMEDGKAGRTTSDAYFNLTGSYLTNDPKQPDGHQ
jgi:lysozyme family protein